MLDHVVPTRHNSPYDIPIPVNVRGLTLDRLSTESPDHSGREVPRTIALKNGDRAGLTHLTPDWIDQMVDLQKTDTGDNIIFRDRAFLEDAFRRGDTALGVVAHGRLIAMTIVQFDTDLMPDSLRAQFTDATRRHAYLGSIVVHPDFQGNGLMGHLIAHSLKEAGQRMGNTDIHARVKVGNDACLRNFTEKFNFATVMTGQSPASDRPREVHFLHRKL